MIPIHKIIEIVCKVTDVTPQQHIYGQFKTNIVYSRFIAAYLIKKHNDIRYLAIADIYGTTDFQIRDRIHRLQDIKDMKSDRYKSPCVILCEMWLDECEQQCNDIDKSQFQIDKSQSLLVL